ncbi:acylphosphatase [Kitasatospora sp. SID7827]|uniref:acylphosphatase n=1 Tax=Kitasatospora sp. SID7827 TaxID=2690335 RepID=UPI0031B85559
MLVSGTVQGVFFRDSCRRAAAEAGVAGWVRNLPDGRVEAVVEGDPDAVEQVVGWLRHGPSRAVVEGVEVIEEQPEGLLVFAVTT